MDFPALSSYERWLVDLAQNIGLSSGEGAVTPWTEIQSYLNLSGLELTMWEIKTIRFLSTVYINGLHEFADEKTAPPFETESTQEQREAAAERRARESWS